MEDTDAFTLLQEEKDLTYAPWLRTINLDRLVIATIEPARGLVRVSEE